MNTALEKSILWCEKYKPEKIEDVIGARKTIDIIVDWLNKFEENKKNNIKENKNKIKKKKKYRCRVKNVVIESNEVNENTETVDDPVPVDDDDDEILEKYVVDNKSNKGPYSCMIITGNHGVGKTCIVHSILNSLGYYIETINYSKIKSSKCKDLLIVKEHVNIIDAFKKIKRKKVFVVDEYDMLTTKNEMLYILNLINSNSIEWYYPIIFITNNHHSKFINDIKKKSLHVILWDPHPFSLLLLLKKIIRIERILINDEENVMKKIVEFSQFDFRRLLFILQDLKYTYSSTILITEKLLNDYFQLTKEKDLKFNLFKCSERILTNYIGINKTLELYKGDCVTVPLMMQQYNIKYLYSFSKNKDNMETAKSIAGLLSKADIIDNYVHNTQNWNIQEAHGFYSCVKPSYLLNKSYTEPIDHFLNKLTFPADMNRTSIKKINKKSIIKLEKNFNNMNIIDYIYMSELIHKLLNDKNAIGIKNLLISYNLTYKDFEKILMIDKMKNQKKKIKIEPKIKKIIKEYFIDETQQKYKVKKE